MNRRIASLSKHVIVCGYGRRGASVCTNLRQREASRDVGVLVVALKRKDGGTVFNPGPDTILQADDVMIVSGQTGSMAQLQKRYS